MNEYQQQLCTESTWDFSDLTALFVNGTLKPSPSLSLGCRPEFPNPEYR